MVLSEKYSIMIGIGLALSLFSGCGSGSTDTVKVEDDNTTTPNNENNNTDPITVGYVSGAGVLIETKSDGTKRAWVNDTSTACLIYRIAQRGGTILAGGTAHCEGLNHGGITTWRMPTEDEAVYLMAHANENSTMLVYPDDNPNCQFMATSTEGRYVYTTNNPSTGAFDDATRGTAGIRCVSDQ